MEIAIIVLLFVSVVFNIIFGVSAAEFYTKYNYEKELANIEKRVNHASCTRYKQQIKTLEQIMDEYYTICEQQNKTLNELTNKLSTEKKEEL